MSAPCDSTAQIADEYQQGDIILYIKSRPLPSLFDIGDVGVLCTFSKTPPAAAVTGIAKSLQLNRGAVQYVMVGGTGRPSQCKPWPLHPRYPGQDAVWRRFSTVRPL